MPAAGQVFTSHLPDVTIPAGPLPGYVLRRALALGGKPALTDAATGDTLSYAQLAAAVGSFAAGLAARGFGCGCIRSGDVGHIDAEGRLFVVDRIKELIKYKGYQVVPAELEALLLSHPAVADAAVIGLPAGADGEVPKGFVVLAAQIPLHEIASYLAERAASYKRLHALEAIAEIPRSATGKILRRVLKEHQIY